MAIKKTKQAPFFKILKAKNGDIFWRLIASNGKEIARSSETYRTRRGVLRSIAIVMDTKVTASKGLA